MTDKDFEIVDLRGRINSLEILGKRYAARIRELEAENELLLSLVCQWSESCTGRHGSQVQCVESCSSLSADAEQINGSDKT